MPVVARDVQKIVRGLLDGGDHRGMGVPRAAHGNSRREIEEPVAVDIPHLGASTASP